MPGSSNPGARARAEAELKEDPRRSDGVIAQAVGCTRQRVFIWRRELERAGIIEFIPDSERVPRPRPPRLATPSWRAIQAGASTSREVMEMSGCAYSTAWAALGRARSHVAAMTSSADVAAAADAISIIKVKAPPAFRMASAICEDCGIRFTYRRVNNSRHYCPECAEPVNTRTVPCKPYLPSIRNADPYTLGWEVPSPAAARLCRDWCRLGKTCPASLARVSLVPKR